VVFRIHTTPRTPVVVSCLMRVVVSCVGSLEPPISCTISLSGRVCLHLSVHLSGYHRNAVATFLPPAHTLRIRALVCNFRHRLSIVRADLCARARARVIVACR
jgi:hypothetical protein